MWNSIRYSCQRYSGAVNAILRHFCPPLIAQRPQCHLSHSESRLVDRATQLICIWIYIWCQHSNTKDIAGQSAKSRLSYQSNSRNLSLRTHSTGVLVFMKNVNIQILFCTRRWVEENAGEVELIQTRLTCETGLEKTLISQNGTKIFFWGVGELNILF